MNIHWDMLFVLELNVHRGSVYETNCVKPEQGTKQ
jgi:hypothetical protein